MRPLDWIIMSAPLLVVAIIGLYTRRYVRSVADFMAGGRNAGRYLMCTARSGMGGAAIFVAGFENFDRAGWGLAWWDQMFGLVGLIMGIFAFVTYRYRQTRALTLAQFFEMRYSRRFRIFCGGLAFFAGLVNYGIIPIVGATFFVYFLQLPPTVMIFAHAVATKLVLMAVFLTVSTLLVTLGGQITVLATDCAEGMFGLVAALIICIPLLLSFHHAQSMDVLINPRMGFNPNPGISIAQPVNHPGYSLVNPFDAFKVQDWNFWMKVMGIFLGIYGTMTWQNAHAFNSCALTPHEGRMGGIIGGYRNHIGAAMGSLLALAAMTYLYHPDYAASAAQVYHAVNQVPAGEVRRQQLYPLAITTMLPIGIRGLLCSTLLMGLLSTDGMHLHSWSSILVQDVIMPLRKRPLSVRQHLLLLRLGMVLVAVCAFIFGALFRQGQFVQMWFGITQSIFCGGAGAIIIGGLYWKRGTTAAAWVAMITGSVLSVVGIVLLDAHWNTWHPASPTWSWLASHLGENFYVHGTHMNAVHVNFVAMGIAVTAYVVVSLLTCRQPHNMDQLLHRGAYAVEPETRGVAKLKRRFDLARIIGVNEEFTRGDRWLTAGRFAWTMAWFALFVVGTTVQLCFHRFTNHTWANFWLWANIWINLPIGVVTTIWFTIGCTHDMRVFFRRLRAEQEDDHDDGTVSHDPQPEPEALVSEAKR